VDQALRLKDLERENSRLKRVVAELSLEKQILKDAAALLKEAGRRVGRDRVERIWRREGAESAAATEAARERLWLNDGSCVRLRPEHENHLPVQFRHDSCARRL
jgi:hypothetical protein